MEKDYKTDQENRKHQKAVGDEETRHAKEHERLTDTLLLDAMGSDVMIESKLISRVKLAILISILFCVIFSVYYNHVAQMASWQAEYTAGLALKQARQNEETATNDRVVSAKVIAQLQETLADHRAMQRALEAELTRTKELNRQLRNEIGAIADVKTAEKKK